MNLMAIPTYAVNFLSNPIGTRISPDVTIGDVSVSRKALACGSIQGEAGG